MNLTPFSVALAAIALAFSAGCQNSRSARIERHAELFATLDGFSQSLIRQGLINFGFNDKMVEMALGEPNRITTATTEEGSVVFWTYRNYVIQNSEAATIGTSPANRHVSPVMVSSSVPRGGPSLFSTKAGPSQATVALDEGGHVGTLEVKFVEGLVAAAVITR